jgi:hypothetical protein
MRDSDELCVDSADVALYLRRLFLPLRREQDVLFVALADRSAENQCWLRARYGAVHLTEVSRAELLDEIGRRFESKLTDHAIFSLAREHPELSARNVISKSQSAGLTVMALLAICALLLNPYAMLAAFVAAMTLFFIVGTFFRVLLSLVGGLPRDRAPATAQRNDPTLPLYSILVPLYREAEIVADLVRALLSLEYPRDRLDIKFVVEADDAETAKACDALAGPHGFEIVRVPFSLPRTKPKAANYALRHAQGDYLVIYDAEDRPEPDQLLKAIGAFRDAPRTVACLQARLAFHNRDRWLTKSFAIDYFTWFG